MDNKKNKKKLTTTDGRQKPKKLCLRMLVVPICLIAIITLCAGSFISYRNQKACKERTDYNKLAGDWVRPDGGYRIHIMNVDTNGEVHLAYFNPNPINVAQANIASQNNVIKLFIELQDAGYPGSKYNLIYNPGKDTLEGTYFQAQIQQLYNVVFLRTKISINL